MITISKNEILPTALNWKKQDWGEMAYALDEDFNEKWFCYIDEHWGNPYWEIVYKQPDLDFVDDGWERVFNLKAVAQEKFEKLPQTVKRAEIAVMFYLKQALPQLSESDKAKAITIINKVRAFYGKL